MAERKARILIVDDDDAQRYSLQRPLLLSGHECHEARTGTEALARIREIAPDLVVLDVRLPDRSGFEVCRLLKADPVTASILVLHVSAAEIAPEAKAYGLQGGADGYLVTPIHPRELVASVDALLRLRAAETEREQTAQQLLEVLEGISGAYVSVDADGRVTYANPEAERLLGHTRAELFGRVLWPELPEALGAALRRHGAAARDTGAELRFEEYDPRFRRWFEGRAVPTRRGVSLFFDDVTTRRGTEQELFLSEQRLRLAADATGVGTWDYRPLENQLHWDNRVRELFGLTPEDPVDYDIFLRLLHPEDRARTDLAVRAALADLDNPTYDMEYRAIGPHDGLVRWISAKGRVFHTADGKPGRMVGTALDAGPARQREQELRRVAEYAEQLVAIVGHDLRSPLAAVQVSAELLARQPDSSEHTRKHVRQILSSTRRATRLTRQILDLTQARLGGGLRLEKAAHALNDTVRRVAEEVGTAHPEHRLELELAASPDAGVWDDERIAQAIANILANAVAHGDKGSPIHVSTRGLDSVLEVAIHNHGPPIPESALPTLFEPFHGASNRRSSHGHLGLGLYIVDQIVRAHGGAVTVRSDASAGTTCVLTLPRG